jgi:CO/xanthine dehydrogenase Mo-binding subunit
VSLGEPRPRIDAEPKVRGAIRYAADLEVPGLLHVRPVLAFEAHARILRVEREAALHVPGVVAVLTASDLPIRIRGETRAVEPVAREEIVFAGQPVALVVGETEVAAEDGTEAVFVDTEPLEPVLDLDAALAPDAPPARVHRIVGADKSAAAAHAAVGEADAESERDEPLSPNALGSHVYRHGDAAGALAGADAVVRGTFTTSWVHQAPLEPQVALAWVEPDGQLVVHSSTQAVFYTQRELARIFDLPLPLVRVVPEPLGGAFGSKFLLIEPLAAAAALALRRPVRIAFTRSEELAAANPAPASKIELELGARRDGGFVALRARLVLDAGAFSENAIDGIAGVLIGGPYRWPAFEVRSSGTLTNRVGTGAYRGPGAPQTAFALESLIDELACELALDPLALRLANAAAEGDLMIDRKRWPTIGARECIEALAEQPVWKRRDSLPDGEGVGVAIGAWPGANESAAAVCRLDADGGLTVLTGVVDMSGATSGFATIAAEEFGIPVENVRVVTGDSANAPHSPPSGGSVVTYSAGRAVARAAEDARRQLLEIAASELEIAASDLELVEGVVQAVGAPARAISVVELAAKLADWGSPHPPVEGRGAARPSSLAPSVAGHLAHVRVDRDTGEVEVLGLVVVQDVGHVLNRALVDGQMRGGTAQGLGWALYEQLVYDDAGNLLTGSLLTYALPAATRVPPIETVTVEVPAPDGPFGAKGIGEASVIAVSPAIANAVAAATGIRLRRLPMTAQHLWRELTIQSEVVA